MACAHQRLGWIPPLMDGNGRVMRLHIHTLLSSLGYTNGLWSPLRGFARGQERFTPCWPMLTARAVVIWMVVAIGASRR